MATDRQEPLWIPSPERAARATMTAFRAFVFERHGLTLPDTPALHRWSLEEPALFWEAVWDFFGVIGEKGERRLIDGDKMPGARFFPDAVLNFSENLLRLHPDIHGKADAIVFRAEDKAEARWSWNRLRVEVSRIAQALEASGIRPGDRVAALLPNAPEAVACMLAAVSLGAVDDAFRHARGAG